MQIFITGASGFIGTAITEALAHTHAVKAMSRSEQSDKLYVTLVPNLCAQH